MPAYKDEKSKKWYVSFYVKENGTSKKVKKMGFNKKQEAMEYERNYINSFVSDTEITFENLYKSYMDDQKNRLKPSTLESKTYIFDKKILSFFQKYKIKEITPLLVRKWQNELIKGNHAQTYLRAIHEQLVAILNYAVKFYNLNKNPCSAAGRIGKKNAGEMNIWTLEEFKQFIEAIKHKKEAVVGFNILFYTGMRVGEMLALTISDIDFEKHKIRINKTFQRIKRTDVISTPKTPKSKRTIDCPKFVIDIIQNYIKVLYKPTPKTRLFEGFTKHKFQNDIKVYSRKANLKKIRVHDLRHSHATFLLSKGVNIVSLSRRLGHERVSTTLDIYSHVLKEDDDLIRDILNSLYEQY
ncbi:tyrosine-type recombinase/integrase [Leptotrichia massiliensis]|uniref:tyrosine-type recombinase/integrase n=1 Tax=Leptotrichia massiliensis TaxID=1852388 RepID=UPI0008D9CD55|nr:site-specific integrase [Leptotrichia massiliensis]